MRRKITTDLPKGVHRVRAMTAQGARFYFYAWRGGPRFWIDSERRPSDPGFFAELAKLHERPKTEERMTPSVVDDFLDSPFMPKADRSKADYRLWLLRFAAAFKDDPIRMFEEPESRGEINEWRKKWQHSPKMFDYAGTIISRFLTWAWKEATVIREHHFASVTKLYKAERAEIVWRTSDQEAVLALAPEWIRRVLIAACETGLRAGDLIKLSRNQIEATDAGRRIRVRTAKRGVYATIPVTPAMGEVIDATKADRLLILTNASGRPLTEHRISEGLRQWRDKAGLTPEALGYDLRLNDARGTAATRLLRAGLSLNEIASHMGWSVRTAAAVIAHYAEVSPAETDAVLVKLEAFRAKKKRTSL